MERVARREKRSLSELVRETFRRYQATGPLPETLADALKWVREDAKRKGVKLTQCELNTEIAATRRPSRRGRRNQPGR
jgi:hypothetical protein